MSFPEENNSFEGWLRTQCAVDEGALAEKHRRMAESPFRFLRATFFSWARKIESIFPDLAKAPSVLSVGDTHTENFGTWRDLEGRLVWGVNDFDEAAVIPCTFDLLRLATSVRLAPKATVKNREGADAILQGYLDGLLRPRPTLLDEQEIWMREFVSCSDDNRQNFWREINACPDVPRDPDLVAAFERSFPDPQAIVSKYAKRTSGGGSLGRPRFIVVANWRGGLIVREAKALTPSAWNWAHDTMSAENQFLDLAQGPHRAPDPYLTTHDKFIFRRLAADSRKIDMRDIAGADLPPKLLRAMGFDLGSIHAADPRSVEIPRHFDGLPQGWLHAAAKEAAVFVEQDFAEWRSGRP